MWIASLVEGSFSLLYAKCIKYNIILSLQYLFFSNLVRAAALSLQVTSRSLG